MFNYHRLTHTARYCMTGGFGMLTRVELEEVDEEVRFGSCDYHYLRGGCESLALESDIVISLVCICAWSHDCLCQVDKLVNTACHKTTIESPHALVEKIIARREAHLSTNRDAVWERVSALAFMSRHFSASWYWNSCRCCRGPTLHSWHLEA